MPIVCKWHFPEPHSLKFSEYVSYPSYLKTRKIFRIRMTIRGRLSIPREKGASWRNSGHDYTIQAIKRDWKWEVLWFPWVMEPFPPPPSERSLQNLHTWWPDYFSRHLPRLLLPFSSFKLAASRCTIIKTPEVSRRGGWAWVQGVDRKMGAGEAASVCFITISRSCTLGKSGACSYVTYVVMECCPVGISWVHTLNHFSRGFCEEKTQWQHCSPAYPSVLPPIGYST